MDSPKKPWLRFTASINEGECESFEVDLALPVPRIFAERNEALTGPEAAVKISPISI